MHETKAAKPVKEPGQDENMWAMILHLSQLANYVAPVLGTIAPIVIWQIKKDEFPNIDAHGKNVVNWLITAFVASVICVPLIFFVIGIPLLIAIFIAHLAFATIGAIKANSGEVWQYPCTFIKIF